jgi:hypothetical protein
MGGEACVSEMRVTRKKKTKAIINVHEMDARRLQMGFSFFGLGTARWELRWKNAKSVRFWRRAMIELLCRGSGNAIESEPALRAQLTRQNADSTLRVGGKEGKFNDQIELGLAWGGRNSLLDFPIGQQLGPFSFRPAL